MYSMQHGTSWVLALAAMLLSPTLSQAQTSCVLNASYDTAQCGWGYRAACLRTLQRSLEPACRAAAKMGDSLSLDTTLRQCLADEKSARDQLEKEWTQFTPALRQRCVATTQTGGDPSYVEVLVCLQMGRDAGQIQRN